LPEQEIPTHQRRALREDGKRALIDARPRIEAMLGRRLRARDLTS
jgi:hypothetical protein